MKNLRTKIIAFVCVVCVACSFCLHNIPALAGDTDITLDNAPEAQFTNWTFSDVGVEDHSSVTGDVNWTGIDTGNSLDKTLFSGKIQFAGDSIGFGNFYIGGATTSYSDNSFYRGFIFRGFTADTLTFGFQGTDGTFFDKDGATNNQIAVFDSDTACVSLRGNSNLKVAISVEYTSVTNGKVTMKVGVFFNGKLYDNTYYTVKDVPEAYLMRNARWKAPAGTNAFASYKVGPAITLDDAPEKDFETWTFKDLGISDGILTTDANWDNTTAISASLDKTLFRGKVGFNTSENNTSNLFIGGVGDTTTDGGSKWRGIRFDMNGTTGLSLSFMGTGGVFFDKNGNTGSTALVPLATFDATTAGTDLRGNNELEIAVSVEYLNEAEGVTDIKIGVFFNGKLYDNTYYTVADVPTVLLHQNVKVKAVTANNSIASYVPTLPEPEEDITLETAPEKDFACWTFEDLDIADQTLTANLNWGDNWKMMTLGDSLDKTIFNGLINFPADTNNFGNLYLGGASANDASKWRGFVFVANSTTDKLGFGFAGTDGKFYNENGNTGSTAMANLLATFDSDTAGTALRGNSNLQVSMSVEYVSTTDTTATIKVGVFFDGKLYNNQYFTIKDVPLEYLNQNIRFYAVGQNNEIKSMHLCDKANEEKEDIYLKDTKEKDFACWTFEDLGIDDQYLSVHLNWGDDWKEQTIGDSLDKTIFNGLINFPSDTDNFGNFYLGGASESEASKWRGFVFVANSTTDKLGFGFMGPDGMFYNKYGNTRSGAMASLLATFDSETAGAQLRGNSNLQLSMSVEYVETTETTADLKVGVFFNGKLYNGEYFTIKDVPLEYLNQNIRFYAVGPNNEIASSHLCSKGNGNDIPSSSAYEELTLQDFSILDRYANAIEEGKDFRAENYRDWETLDGTAVSVVCNFPENGSGRFSVGGSFWRGVYVGSRTDGRVEVCYVNAAGEMKRLAFLDAETAGVKTLLGRDVTIRLTFDIKETSDTLCDLKLGVYINGKLYDGKHYTVRNAEIETLTRTFKVYATDAPFSVKSIITQPDLSKYGFDNKTWKKKI